MALLPPPGTKPALLAMAWAVALTAATGCSRVPEPAPPPVAPRPPFRLGRLYWAPEVSVFDTEPALILGGRVVELRPPAPGRLAGAATPECRIRVERVYFARPPAQLRTEPGKAYEGEEELDVDGCGALSTGDHVVVVAEDYDNGYGIVPKSDGGCDIGLRVSGWDDPAIARLRGR